MGELIGAIYRNKNVLPLIDTFETEMDEIEKLINNTNGDLLVLKEIFKDEEVVQVSREGLPYARYFKNTIPGSLNCAKDENILSYNFLN